MATRNEMQRSKAGLKAADALDKACTAMNAYMRTCSDCGEPLKGMDDSRLLLVEAMSEYSTFLAARFGKKGGSA